MKRRDFLNISSKVAAASPFLLNSMSVKAFSPFSAFTPDCFSQQERVIVLIQMRGGNDGLNMVVPRSLSQYPEYKALRQDIKLPEGELPIINDTVDVDDDYKVALHPKMVDIKDMYTNGEVNIIQNVGFLGQGGSHFQSQDLYSLAASPSSAFVGDGWLGRFLDSSYGSVVGNPDYPMQDPVGLQFGNKKPSLAFLKSGASGLYVKLSGQNPSGFYNQITQVGLDPILDTPCTAYGAKLDYILDIENTLDVYSERISKVYNVGTNSSAVYPTYPSSSPISLTSYFGNQLKTIARMINGGCKTKIYLVDMPGLFDTHANQVIEGNTIEGRHGNLMRVLSEGVKAFMDDLENMGYADRVTLLTFSEFGRTADQNGNLGTDHGSIAPMLMFGKHVKGGVFGPNPILTTLNGRSPTTNDLVDFRTVFGSLLKDWLGASNQSIAAALPGFTLNSLDLFKPDAYADQDCSPMEEGYPTGPVSYSGTIVILNEGTETLPIQEVTSCDMVILAPGFEAPLGSNIRVFPSVCPEIPQPRIAGKGPTPDRLFKEILDLNPDFGSVEAFPNPFSKSITISIKPEEGENEIKVSILDSMGRMININVIHTYQVDGYYSYMFDGSHLAPGIYFVNVVSEKHQRNIKVMKAN